MANTLQVPGEPFKQHIICADNWFCTKKTVEAMVGAGYHMYGTAKKNCGFDKEMKWDKAGKNLSMGDSRGFRSIDPQCQYIFQQFKDRKVVSGFSTIHPAVNGSAASLAKIAEQPGSSYKVRPFKRNRRGPDGKYGVAEAHQPTMFADYTHQMGCVMLACFNI